MVSVVLVFLTFLVYFLLHYLYGLLQYLNSHVQEPKNEIHAMNAYYYENYVNHVKNDHILMNVMYETHEICGMMLTSGMNAKNVICEKNVLQLSLIHI